MSGFVSTFPQAPIALLLLAVTWLACKRIERAQTAARRKRMFAGNRHA